MSYPDPEIVKSDGLLRLKWEEERERASCPDLLCFGTADMDYRSPEPVLASLKSVCARAFGGIQRYRICIMRQYITGFCILQAGM